MANLTGMFQLLSQATGNLGDAIVGKPSQLPLAEQNVMERAGVRNPMLRMFGQGLGGMLGKDMSSPADQMRKSMSGVDMNSPDAMLQMAAKIKDYDPVAAANLIKAHQQVQADRLRAIGSSQAGKGYTTTEGPVIKDSEGNHYQSVIRTDKTGGVIDTVHVPIGDAPPYDPTRGSQVVVGSGAGAGLTPTEFAQMKIDAASEKEATQEYNALRREALSNYTDAVEERKTLDTLVGMIEEAQEAGDLQGGLPQDLKQRWYEITGTTPANLSELNTMFGSITYSFLRQLFGSQITEGERQAVEDIFLNIRKSGTANKAALRDLRRQSDKALTKLNLYKDNKTYRDFDKALDAFDERLEQEAGETITVGRFKVKVN